MCLLYLVASQDKYQKIQMFFKDQFNWNLLLLGLSNKIQMLLLQDIKQLGYMVQLLHLVESE